MNTINWTSNDEGLHATYNGFSLAILPSTGLNRKVWYTLTINDKAYSTQPSEDLAKEFAERLRPFMDNPTEGPAS